ncbi:hypothetical protein JXA70_04225 [candidate division KSB1 bacterium]|nr:hypothetical protein [candidate division KSB1 bacterium]
MILSKKVLLPFILLSGVLCAQSHLGLNAGFSLPIGDFAKKDASDNAGFARFGFGAGAEYDLIFGESGIAWSSSFFYIANDYQTDEEFKWIPDFQLQDTGAYTNYSFGTGIKYIKDFSDKFSGFAYGQLGMNLTNGPYFGGYIADSQGNLALVEVEMGRQTTRAFSIGLGFIANRTTTVSLRYFALGSPVFSSTAYYALNNKEYAQDIEWKQPMSLFLLTVGYTINFND